MIWQKNWSTEKSCRKRAWITGSDQCQKKSLRTKIKQCHVKRGQSKYKSSTKVWNSTKIIYVVSNTIFKEAKLTEKDNLDFVQMILTKEINLKENTVRHVYLSMPKRNHACKLLNNFFFFKNNNFSIKEINRLRQSLYERRYKDVLFWNPTEIDNLNNTIT